MTDNINNPFNYKPADFTTNGEFDLGKFNDSFDKSKEEQKQITKINDTAKLNSLNQTISKKSLFQLSTGEMLIGIKDTWFGIIDDIIHLNFYTNQGKQSLTSIFIKDDRMFYIGLTLLIIALGLYLYNYFDEEFYRDDNNFHEEIPVQKIIEKHYFYGDKQTDDLAVEQITQNNNDTNLEQEQN